MKSKKIISASLCLLSICLTSCGSSSYRSLDSIVSDGTLNVTTNAEFVPFEYVDGDNVTGVDIDIISAYAKSIGVTANIQNIDFDAALISVSTYKSDCAIAGITKNSKREETMDFSSPYYTSAQVAIVKNGSTYASCTDAASLLKAFTDNKATIGCQRGTTGEYYIEGDEGWGYEKIADTTCVTYDNGGMACMALNNGQIDAVIIDLVPAENYCKTYTGLTCMSSITFTSEEYAVAFAKGNTTLVDSFNSFMTTAKTDGTLNTIIDKYF